MSETASVEPEPADDAAPGEDPAPSEIEDLALAIPEWTMAPLAIALSVLMWVGFDGDRVLVAVVPFVVMLAVMTVIDLRELRIPNRLLAPAAVAALPLLLVAATSAWPDVSVLRALVGAAVLGAAYFVIWFIYPPGMGWGDVKLAPLIGAQLAFFGWIPFVRSLIVGHLVSGVVAIVIVLIRLVSRRGRRWKVAFPFGPFMAIGAVTALALEAFV